jgi:hypothetical protein
MMSWKVEKVLQSIYGNQHWQLIKLIMALGKNKLPCHREAGPAIERQEGGIESPPCFNKQSATPTSHHETGKGSIES